MSMMSVHAQRTKPTTVKYKHRYEIISFTWIEMSAEIDYLNASSSSMRCLLQLITENSKGKLWFKIHIVSAIYSEWERASSIIRSIPVLFDTRVFHIIKLYWIPQKKVVKPILDLYCRVCREPHTTPIGITKESESDHDQTSDSKIKKKKINSSRFIYIKFTRFSSSKNHNQPYKKLHVLFCIIFHVFLYRRIQTTASNCSIFSEREKSSHIHTAIESSYSDCVLSVNIVILSISLPVFPFNWKSSVYLKPLSCLPVDIGPSKWVCI